MKKLIAKWLTPLLIVGVMAGLLTACGGGRKTDLEYLSDAKQAFSNYSYKETMINLKNALQENPNNAEARWLLGQVYLDIGAGQAAEKELSKAQALGVSGMEIVRDLMQAYNLQHEYQKTISEVNSLSVPDRDGSAEISILYVEALFGQKQLKDAGVAIAHLMSFEGTRATGNYLQARLNFLLGKNAQAYDYLSKAKSAGMSSTRMSLFEADLLMSESKFVDAEKVYDGVIAAEAKKNVTKDLMDAYIGQIKTYLALGKNKDASSLLTKVEAVNNKNILVKYIKGIIDFRMGRYADAQINLMEVLKVKPNFAPALLLLATSNFALANYEQASEQLSSFVTMQPGNVQAQKLLAVTQLRLDQPKAAIASLNSAMQYSAEDAELLSLMGSAVIQSGRVDEGTKILEKAASGQGASAHDARVQLASVYMSQGKVDLALNQLDGQIGADSGSLREDTLVVMGHIKNKDYGQAEDKAKQVVKKYEKDPRAYNLLGTVYIAKGETRNAIAQFETAVSLDSKYLAAHKNLASLYFSEGDQAAATKSYNNVLKIDANDVEALVGLARIDETSGNQDKAVSRLEQARAANSIAQEPRVLLGNYYMRSGQLAKAVEIEKELANIPRLGIAALEFRGGVLLRVGDKEAESVYTKLTTLQPKNHLWYYRLGLASENNGNKDAIKHVRKAYQLAPDYLPASSKLVVEESNRGNFAEAERIVGAIRKQNPTSPAADVLAGDVATLKKDHKSAASYYKTALDRVQSNQIFVKYARATLVAGNRSGFESETRSWLDEHPSDMVVKQFYAATLASLGKKNEALEQYKQVLDKDANNVVALNEIALLQYALGKKSDAVKNAEKAAKLAPQSGEIADTYGWLLFNEERYQESVAQLSKANELLPNVPEVAYHYAQALVKTNQKEQARKLLLKLVKVEFSEKASAEALLKSIN